MTLDDLIARAEELRSGGGHDNRLADELNAAANARYGVTNRSPEFLHVLQLGSSIREIKKPEWKSQIEVLATGLIPGVQEEGYFYITQYGVGRVDLLKDGQRTHRMYGAVLKIKPEQGKLKPGTFFCYDNFHDYTANRARFRRGRELLTQIIKAMDMQRGDSAYGALLETEANDNFEVYGGPFDTLGPKFESAVQQGSYTQFFAHNVSAISERIARADQNIRQVGSVVDGGKRYKK